MLTDFLLASELSPTMLLIIIMVVIFLLGWPLEWVPIILIIVPIIIPLLVKLEINLVWFGILVAVNLQTAWLSPPVALSAYFLKGVSPRMEFKRYLHWHDAVYGDSSYRPDFNFNISSNRLMAAECDVRQLA